MFLCVYLYLARTLISKFTHGLCLLFGEAAGDTIKSIAQCWVCVSQSLSTASCVSLLGLLTAKQRPGVTVNRKLSDPWLQLSDPAILRGSPEDTFSPSKPTSLSSLRGTQSNQARSQAGSWWLAGLRAVPMGSKDTWEQVTQACKSIRRGPMDCVLGAETLEGTTLLILHRWIPSVLSGRRPYSESSPAEDDGEGWTSVWPLTQNAKSYLKTGSFSTDWL